VVAKNDDGQMSRRTKIHRNDPEERAKSTPLTLFHHHQRGTTSSARGRRRKQNGWEIWENANQPDALPFFNSSIRVFQFMYYWDEELY
jgi:hypothetical protein